MGVGIERWQTAPLHNSNDGLLSVSILFRWEEARIEYREDNDEEDSCKKQKISLYRKNIL
jgi:hypothetical protein